MKTETQMSTEAMIEELKFWQDNKAKILLMKEIPEVLPDNPEILEMIRYAIDKKDYWQIPQRIMQLKIAIRMSNQL